MPSEHLYTCYYFTSSMNLKFILLFQTLQKLGKTTTGPLAKESNIPTSHIYKLLEEMKDEGLVSTSLENNKTYFEHTSVEALERYLNQDKDIINDILEKSKNLEQTSKSSNSSIQEFNGIKSIKGMWDIMNATLTSKSRVKLYTATKESYQNLIGFYDEHHRIQKVKNVTEKMIFDSNDDEAKRRLGPLTEVKVTKLSNRAEFGIINDLAFFQYTISNNPKGYLIKDALLVETLNQMFDQIWDSAKKL